MVTVVCQWWWQKATSLWAAGRPGDPHGQHIVCDGLAANTIPSCNASLGLCGLLYTQLRPLKDAGIGLDYSGVILGHTSGASKSGAANLDLCGTCQGHCDVIQF